MRKVMKKEKEYEKIYNEAYNAGMKAGKECITTPMIVAHHANMADDNSPIEKAWIVPDGPCGFAWVVITSNNDFVKWLKTKGLARKGLRRTCWIPCTQFMPSLARQLAWAKAFAEVLASYGIDAYADSRLD